MGYNLSPTDFFKCRPIIRPPGTVVTGGPIIIIVVVVVYYSNKAAYDTYM